MLTMACFSVKWLIVPESIRSLEASYPQQTVYSRQDWSVLIPIVHDLDVFCFNSFML